ncbi:hypothetical protein [Deinococcus psychrotolerans]|uniref:hypothetical protein n=1 Tax=Deinococcus psychrotolerans TaxID=2489213 RepID=UPI0013DDFFFC|nr:hypothetical protein [Deinococcus psychrotolerans]
MLITDLNNPFGTPITDHAWLLRRDVQLPTIKSARRIEPEQVQLRPAQSEPSQ